MNKDDNAKCYCIVVAMRGRGGNPYKQVLEPNGSLVTNALTTAEKDILILEITQSNSSFIVESKLEV